MGMFNEFEVVPDKVRTIELENGNKLFMTRSDPYGFITLSLMKGPLPDHLKDQSFTDWSFAIIAADKYLEQRKMVVKEIKDNTKVA